MSNVTNRYVNMEFPPYQYREYPKMIKASDGTNVIVRNEVQELQVLNAGKDESEGLVEDLKAQTIREAKTAENNHDRDALLSRAGGLGIVIDKRWSIQKIKDLIVSAENALQTESVGQNIRLRNE